MNVLQLTKTVLHHNSISKPVQVSDMLKLREGYIYKNLINQNMPFPKHGIDLTKLWYIMT